VNRDAIPAELRALPQWVVWRREQRDGKATKVPYDAVDPQRLASSTDPDTWSAYTYAVKAVERGAADGIGFVFAPHDPFCGLDFDDCVHGGEIDPYVRRVVRLLDSYGELSPSGTGLHVIARAELAGTRRRTSKTPWGGEFELYDRGRYFTMTGCRLDGAPATVNERQELVDAAREQLLPEPERPRPQPRATAPASVDDAELLERAHAASNGADFGALLRGDTSGYPSWSEADLALCNHLAFWTGGDHARIDTLFRSSGLMRDKWDERRGDSTYGADTIDKALEGRTEFYSPPVEYEPVSGSLGERLRAAAGPSAPRSDDAGTRGASVHPRIIDMAQAMAHANDPLPYRVNPLAMDGFVTVLVGRRGDDKTWLGLIACNAAANGVAMAPFSCNKGPALLLDAESGARLLARRFVLLGLDGDAFTVADGMGLRLPRDIGQVRALVDSVGARLLILDSLRRLTPGGREDKSDDMAPVMTALATLSRETDCAVVILHNRSTKPNAPDMRGSSALEDQADIVWVLERLANDPERKTRRRLRNTKMRVDVEHAPIWLDFKVTAGFMTMAEAVPYAGADQSGEEDKAPPADEVMAERIRVLAGQIDMNGGWLPSRLAAAVGSSQRSGTFQRALGLVLADGWTVTGETKARRIRPPDSRQSHQPLWDGADGANGDES
jgi:hypothetical protein